MRVATMRSQVVRVAAVLLAILLGGCGLAGSTRHEDAQQELNRNRRQWEAQGVENYRYVGRRNCFCPGEVVSPVIVEVRGGEVASLVYQESGEPVTATYAGLWPTIYGVFDLVQEAIDREAAGLRVEYDPDRGHPSSISIDYSEQAVDEELGYRVEELEAVQPTP